MLIYSLLLKRWLSLHLQTIGFPAVFFKKQAAAFFFSKCWILIWILCCPQAWKAEYPQSPTGSWEKYQACFGRWNARYSSWWLLSWCRCEDWFPQQQEDISSSERLWLIATATNGSEIDIAVDSIFPFSHPSTLKMVSLPSKVCFNLPISWKIRCSVVLCLSFV